MILRELRNFAGAILVLGLAACGGGGGGAADTSAGATAVVKLGLGGAIPASGAITGVAFTLALPKNASIATGTDGAVADGAVVISGPAAGKFQVFAKTYTASPAVLALTLVSTEQQGYLAVGELASVSYHYPAGAAPLPADFSVSGTVTGNVPGATGVKIGEVTPVVLP